MNIKQPRTIEYFFKEELDGDDLNKNIWWNEMRFCITNGWFDAEEHRSNKIMVHTNNEVGKWFRNTFLKDDDQKKYIHEMLYVNSNGVVINDDDFDKLEDDLKKKKISSKTVEDFQPFYENNFMVHDGKLNLRMVENSRNGNTKDYGSYEDGKRHGMFICQRKDGCCVGGEYKNNKLVKTYSGLMKLTHSQ